LVPGKAEEPSGTAFPEQPKEVEVRRLVAERESDRALHEVAEERLFGDVDRYRGVAPQVRPDLDTEAVPVREVPAQPRFDRTLRTGGHG
jgi:hypothetical protein